MKTPYTAIEAIVGKTDSRQYIRHVYLDRENSRMVATNGSAAAFVPVPADTFAEQDTTGFVTLEAIAAARKMKHMADSPDALLANGSLAVSSGPTFPRPTVEELGKYPDVDRIATPKHAQAFIQFDAALLLQLAKALHKHGEKCLGVRVYLPYDGTTAMRVEPTTYGVERADETDPFGIIMPMRVSGENCQRNVYPAA